MSIVVSILLVIHLWLAIKFLMWPAFRMWKAGRYIEKGEIKIEMTIENVLTSTEKELSWLESYDVLPSRTTILSMGVGGLVWLWAIFAWGTLYAFGGTEGFCKILLNV